MTDTRRSPRKISFSNNAPHRRHRASDRCRKTYASSATASYSSSAQKACLPFSEGSTLVGRSSRQRCVQSIVGLAQRGRRPGGTLLRSAYHHGEPALTAAAKTAPKFSEVTLAGVMIDKCPVAGCWFRLRDTTGVIKIDTKSAGFAVVNVPLERKVVVSGTIATEGDEITMAANGIRY